jgi:hypothetical protein
MPILYERKAEPNWIDDPGREPAAEVSAEEERVRCGMGSVCCLGQGRLTSQFSNIITTSSALAIVADYLHDFMAGRCLRGLALIFGASSNGLGLW